MSALPTCVNGPDDDVERFSRYPSRSNAETGFQLSWTAPPTTVAVRPVGIGGAFVSRALTEPEEAFTFPRRSFAHTTDAYVRTPIGTNRGYQVPGSAPGVHQAVSPVPPTAG